MSSTTGSAIGLGGVLKDFREFAIKGNVVDLAVGVIIGGAFGTIVTSLVNDVIMPPIGLLVGDVDFSNLFVVLKPGTKAGTTLPYHSVADAKAAGAVTLNLGLFVNTVINFIIVAFSVFLLVKAISKLRRHHEEAAPPGPTPDQLLLTELRDLLKSQAKRP